MIKKLCFIRWYCWLLLFITTGLSAQNALNFDGTDDYVQTTYAGVSGSAQRTVELWVKPSAAVTTEQLLIEWGSDAVNGQRFTLRINNNGGGVGVFRVEVKGDFLVGTINLNDGNWHHLAVTYDHSLSTNRCKIYVDGTLDGQKNFTVTPNTQTTYPMIIGRRIPTLANAHFNGTIDDVRIWDIARTQAEVQTNMNTEFCAIPANLKAYYKFSEALAGADNTTLSTINDSAGGNTGTLNGFALNGATSNFVAGPTTLIAGIPPTATATLTGTTLTADTVAGASYQWLDCNNSNLPITGATSATYTPTFSGSFAVKVSLNGGCFAVSSCTPVTVTGCNINPTLSVNNNTATALQTGATYQWIDTDNANAPIAGATAASFTPTYSSHYAVVITTSECNVTSSSVLLCGGTPTVTLSGTTLTALPAGGTYQWINCATSTPVSGATSQTFTPTIDGNYSVQVTLFGTCTSTSACTQVILPSLPNALIFDTTGDYVQTTFTGMSGTNARTVEAWIKVPVGNANTQRYIVDWGNTGTSTTNNRFGLNINANKLQLNVTGSVNLAGTTTLADGNWHHVAVTYDPTATNKITLYLDGNIEASGNTSTAVNTGSTTNLPVRIGAGISSTSSNLFNGTIDEVRIWDVVRTQAEIAGAKDAELCTIPSSLKAYYKFNKGVPGGTNTGQTIAPDSAGTANGTLNGFTYSGTTSNWVAGGPLTGAPTATVTLAGTTLTVNTTAGATYQWVDCANSNAAISGATAVDYTPTASGNYAVIVTGSNGCTTTSACTQVTIAPACTIDNTVTLNGTTLTATQAGATYQWVDCADDANISGATNAAFTPTATGNYKVVITMGAGCTATSACTSVTVCNVNNTVTLAGTTLTATQTGATYQWVDCDNSNAAISGATNATYTPTASGNYAVEITMGAGCTATSTCSQVCVVNNAVTLNGTTLTATQAGATYQWVDCANDTNIAGATNATFTPATTGNYKVVVTMGTCTATSACTPVTICNLTASATLAGTTLTANTVANATYQWVDCNNTNAAVAGATAQTFTPAVTGNYAVTITDANNCTATSTCTPVTITVCNLDNTVTLNAGTLTATQAGATYQWVDCATDTNIAGATNAAYTPTVAGNYKVVITAGACTATSACTAVTPCAVDATVTLAGTTLTATQTGATYQWVDCATDINILGATNVSYTPTASGNYKVVITMANGCTATSACTPATVCNVNDAVTLAGTTLTATQTGATYQWINCAINTFISNATAISYTPTVSGNYAVIVTMPNGCTVTTACTAVTICNVNNAVTLAGTTLTATQTGATYQWIDCATDTNISGATAQAYTPTITGNYKVVVTMGTCTTTSTCTPVTICNVNNAVTLVGTTLTATQTGATYQWVDCATDTNIAGATAAAFTPTVTGNYKVVVTMGTCTATSACTQVTIQTGPVGPVQNALHFDGTNDFVMTDYSAISSNTARTVEAWIKIPANNTVERMIVDWGSSTARFGLSISSANKLKIATSGSTSYTANTSITDGNWHHVAVTYNPSASTDKIKLFLDGVQDGTANPASLSTGTALKVRIGYAITDQFIFSGLIDEVRIWNVARTQAEISGSKDIDLCTIPTSLKAYYKFNQGIAGGNNISETSLHDSAGTNDGTVLNFTRTGATSNWVAGTMLTGAITATATLNGTILTANTFAGATYQWVDCNNANAPVAGATAQTFAPPVTGSYAVIVSNAAGCTATSACVQVTVTGCNLNSTVTLSGTTLTATQAGATFQWVNCANNANIAGATSASYTATVSGNYKVIITAGSCTVTSACTQVTIPVLQNALAFDAGSDYVQTTYPGISGNGARTVEAWIKVPATNAATRFIAEWGTGTSSTTDPNKFGLYVTSGNLLQVTVTNSYNFTGGSTIVADGNWHHVAVTFDNALATNKIKLFVDGVLATSGNPTVDINTGTGTNMIIGRGVTGSGLFNGTMDEVRVWNVARTQAEIQAAMNTEFCTNPANLVAYYNFNQGVAGGTNTGLTTLLNSVGSNNGTLNTFTLTGTTSNWVAGAPGVVSGVPPVATATLAGSTVNANTITGATYQWVDCNNANALVAGATASSFIPTVSGNYAVVITAPGGCSSISSCVQVTAGACNLNPAVTLSGTTLTAAQAGTTYQWVDCNNANAPIAGATAISYTPTVSGNYAVIISAGAGCSITSACTQVCVVNNAVTLVGTTLTATQTGATYQWVDCANNTNIAGATAQTYTPTVNGSYKVIVTMPGGCTVTSACVQVCILDATVTLAGTTLTATQTGATYQWVNCATNANISGATAQSYTPTVSGNYKVVITIGTCTITSACTQICIINPAVTQSGITLTATQTGATYQWINCADNTPIAGATSATYVATATGSYAVQITMGAGCTATSVCTPITICNVNQAVTLNGTTLTATQAGATYQWVNCATNTNITDATAQSYTPTASGNYKVIITMPGGCGATSTCTQVTIVPPCVIDNTTTLAGTTITATQADATYQWIDCANSNTPIAGATSQSFVATVSGNYAVQITLGAGCTATSACTQITICNLSDAVTLNGMTLTATQANASYQWVNCADDTPVAGANAQAFTPETSGNYKVIISTPDNCMVTSACQYVNTCTVTAGVNNNSGTLMAVEVADAAYQWINCDNNNAPIAGETAMTFTPTVSGNYALMVTVGDCSDTSDCQYVLVCNLTDAVTLAGNTLTATQANASYQWINCDDNAPVAGANEQSFTPTVSGNYAVIISTPDNCTVTSVCHEVCVVDVTIVNNGWTLSVNPINGATYQWINCEDNSAIEGETLFAFMPTETGSYAVQVTLAGGCTATSECEEMDVVGIREFDFAGHIMAYPNPTTDIVTIAMDGVYDNVQMTIYNIAGQVVGRQAVGQSESFTVDLTSVARGLYFLDIRTGSGQSAMVKVIRN